MLLVGAPLAAETLRLATWHAPLSREGPGLLLRDLLKGEDPELAMIEQTIASLSPDVLLLTNIDYDHGLAALTALRDRLAERGAIYPNLFARRPNLGMPTGLDLDGDGRLGQPRDAQGFGYFAGQGGMAILSRLPIAAEKVQDFSELLWRDLPGSRIAQDDPGHDIQRLSSSGHWLVPLIRDSGAELTITAFHATPPVFDGPEDRNGRHNADEVRFWSLLLDGTFDQPPEDLVLMGNANLDPTGGDGLHDAMKTLLGDARLRDPLPNAPTAEWPVIGALRVSYILPAAHLQVTGAGLSEPTGPHRLIWVDLALTP